MSRSDLVTLFERYPEPNIAEDDFDDLLWGFVCDRVPIDAALSTLPAPVRVYYVTRTMEWEVANGGLDQLLFNVWNGGRRSDAAVAEFLMFAREGYATLGRHKAVEIIDRVLVAIKPGFANATDEIETIQREALDINDGMDLWSDDQRLAYVVANKDAFIGMVAY